MELFQQFARYNRIFSKSPQIPTSSQKSQENHAEKVQDWLELTISLQYLSTKEKRIAEDILEKAYLSAKSLFLLGDEISAWIGQKRIARTAEELFPGLIAAQHLATSARYAVYQHLHDEAEETLRKMHKHFKETDHPFAAQYWELKGMTLSVRKKWSKAIPYFQHAREHFELAPKNKLKQHLKMSQNDLIAHQNLRIADGLICQAWHMTGKERERLIRDIHAQINFAKKSLNSSTLTYLTTLNEVELLLLEGNLETAE
ncbi:hypothetical protein K8T06_09140, partial [bacterium]|nr:hypothetical protein [bacterium]